MALIEPRRHRRSELVSRYAPLPAWERFHDADLKQFTHAIVATPPLEHWPTLRRLVERGIHVLVEKPLCADERDGKKILKLALSRRAAVRVAFNMRCAKVMREVKKRIDRNVIGRVKIFQAFSGQHFPAFRPDYRSIYWADSGQGGCSLDALTHFVDLSQWFLGNVEWGGGAASNLGLKNVPVDDSACMILKGTRGEQGMIATNQFQAPNEARFVWTGEKGSITVQNPGGVLGSYKKGASSWQKTKFTSGRDDAYILQAKLFMRETSGIDSGLCGVPEAFKNLRLCLKLKKTFKTPS